MVRKVVHSAYSPCMRSCAALVPVILLTPPLQQITPETGYRPTNRTLGEKNSDALFVVLALSGDGTRAAALGYGILEHLDRLQFGANHRSLLDEVDIISSSSKASTPAAYYGLFGQQAFLD
jgi:NTE family protein